MELQSILLAVDSDREALAALDHDLTRRFAVRGTPAFLVNGRLYYGSQQWSWMEQVLLAHERGQPDSAPPPPLAMPTRKVIDEARVRQLEDSLGGTADSVRLLQIRDSLRRLAPKARN